MSKIDSLMDPFQQNFNANSTHKTAFFTVLVLYLLKNFTINI